MTDAKNNVQNYSYDQYGRLTGDARGTYTYDANGYSGLLTQVSFAGGVGPNQLSFQYNYTCSPGGKVTSKANRLGCDGYSGREWVS